MQTPSNHVTEFVANPALTTPRVSWWRPFATKRFVLLSLALHLLLASGATVWIVRTARPAGHGQTFAAGVPTAARAAMHDVEHQIKIAKHQHTMSVPPALRRVIALGSTKLALPAVPALPVSQSVTPLAMAGSGMMPGGGFGLGRGGGDAGGSGGGGGGAQITSFIGGMRITAGKLGVALDVSGSVRDYQQEMHDYVAKVFKGSQVIEFGTAGFFTVQHSRGSMGAAVMEFLNSPQMFDAIYVFSDFGETRDSALREGQEDLWADVKKLVRQKKVKLYLHVLREPGREDKINPILNNVIQFARSTGGSVKIGSLTRVSEGNTGEASNGRSRL